MLTQCYQVLLATALPSPTGDGAAEVTLVMARYRCRVMLVIVLPSHSSDGAAKATCLWHDLDAESCWGQCYRVMMTMAQPRRLGYGVM
jgi:hypothetical protein